jgi:hypothetical protein
MLIAWRDLNEEAGIEVAEVIEAVEQLPTTLRTAKELCETRALCAQDKCVDERGLVVHGSALALPNAQHQLRREAPSAACCC